MATQIISQLLSCSSLQALTGRCLWNLIHIVVRRLTEIHHFAVASVKTALLLEELLCDIEMAFKTLGYLEGFSAERVRGTESEQQFTTVESNPD